MANRASIAHGVLLKNIGAAIPFSSFQISEPVHSSTALIS